MNNSKDVASTADCGRAFQPLSAAGRKECLNTSLLQWGRMNLILLPGVWTVIGVACCDMSQNDTIGKIELNPSFVLSSDNTNYKNDIQLFHQLFDELSVYRDYH